MLAERFGHGIAQHLGPLAHDEEEAAMSIEDDPTSMVDFAFAGTFEYDEGTTMIDAPGEFPDPAPLDLKAVVYFPADAASATDPAQLSDRHDDYPMVVVVHGNSGSLLSYRGYDYLLVH